MLFLLIVIVTTLLFAYLYSKKYKDIFNPLILFIVPIAISFIVNCIYYDPIQEISDATYQIYGTGVLSFAVGVLLCTMVPHAYNGNKKNITPNALVFDIYILASIIGTICAVIYIIKGSGIHAYGNNFMRNIRYYSLYVSPPSGLSKYGIIFCGVILNYLLYDVFVNGKKNKHNKRLLFTMTFMYCIFMMVTFARTVMFDLFARIIFFVYLGFAKKNKKSRLTTNTLRFYFLIFMVGILVLFIFTFIAAKTGKSFGAGGASWLISYFGAEFSVFQKYILSIPGALKGGASLGVISRVLRLFPFLPQKEAYADHALHMQGLGGPVSSFVSNPYLDFGIVGVVLIMIIYGYIISYIYLRHKHSGGIWTMFFATCIYQCIIAFFSFQFGLTSQIYEMVALLILFGIKTERGNVTYKYQLFKTY